MYKITIFLHKYYTLGKLKVVSVTNHYVSRRLHLSRILVNERLCRKVRIYFYLRVVKHVDPYVGKSTTHYA